MNPVTLLQPPRIAVGNGCAQQCAAYLAARGARRVLLVSSAAVLPSLEPVLAAFASGNITVVHSPAIDSEPTISMFNDVMQSARAGNVDAVVGAGGGSAMDVAKLVAALANGAQFVDEVLGINLLKQRTLPLVCLPTTSGTGSEVSPNSILIDERDQQKKAAISPHLVPDAAFVDPTLTVSVPPAITAATGFDALTHCIEAFANRNAHPAVDTYALEGIRLISGNLARAVQNGRDLEARAALSLGSLYGGLCLGPVNTAAVHALAYPLGSLFHVAHGVSNAVLLPAVLRFNAAESAGRYAEIAKALGVSLNGSQLHAAEEGILRVAELSKECGVPQRIRDLGIPRDAIPRLADAAMKVTRLLKNNPRPVTEQDAIAIYEGAY